MPDSHILLQSLFTTLAGNTAFLSRTKISPGSPPSLYMRKGGQIRARLPSSRWATP
jgi:hypothetical protein